MSTILAIETSCDETAVAIIEASGDESSARFTILGNVLLSQIELHRPFGGVFPTLAKREHAKNLVPITRAALEEAELLLEDTQTIASGTHDAIAELLEREPNLSEQFFDFINEVETPKIDAIAVTAGPGLEPALWVGVNFAKALSLAWNIPIVAVNHMEGHILSALATDAGDNMFTIKDVALPITALLISGGHTELVLMRSWLSYELIGQTRDDAVGEAFDKVARMLGLPYPGGPEISRLAENARLEKIPVETTASIATQNQFPQWKLPRPMLHDKKYDFSFSGLKTAVRYIVDKNPTISATQKKYLAMEFEDAVTEVLLNKTMRAVIDTNTKTLVLGGGVSANTHIRQIFKRVIADKYSDVSLYIPRSSLATDNAIMIALAGFYHANRDQYTDFSTIVANGNASLATQNIDE